MGSVKNRKSTCRLILRCTLLLLLKGELASPEMQSDTVDEISNFFRWNKCNPEFFPWVKQETFSSERNEFLDYEKSFKSFCYHNTAPYYLEGDFEEPNPCSSITLCNTTYCTSYGRESVKFLYSVPVSCGVFANKKTGHNSIGLRSKDGKFLEHSIFHMYNLRNPSAKAPKKFALSIMKFEVQFHGTFASRVDSELIQSCKLQGQTDLFYEGEGQLPNECEELRFCDAQVCYVMPLTGNAYSYTFRRKSYPSAENMELPSTCTVTNTIHREKRGLIRIANTESYSDSISRFPETSTYGVLRFNLPGFRYCGPGTDIEEMDDEGGPTNDLDSLCRQHDVDYLSGEDPSVADEKLLKSMWDLKSPFLPLFVAVFESKRYFEKVYGTQYTSSLYFFPEPQQSLVFSLAEKSSYQDMISASPELKTGLRLEENWKTILHDIWQGFCYAQALPTPTQFGNGNNEPASPAPAIAGPSQGSSRQMLSEGGNPTDNTEEMDEESQPDQNFDFLYPKVPKLFGTCRLVISEIATEFNELPTFIELQRFCPKQLGRIASTSLRGYHLLIAQVGDPSSILMSINLGEKKMKIVKERFANTLRERSNLYFVIGSDETNPDLRFEDIEQFVASTSGSKAIPGDDEQTYAVLLLYFPSQVEAQIALSEFTLRTHQDFHMPRLIMDDQRHYIELYIQDLAIYGAPCPSEECKEFVRLLKAKQQVQPVNDLFIPIPHVRRDILHTNSPYSSLNRCTKNQLPMQMDSFLQNIPSPGARNICPEEPRQGKFNMQGVSIQSSAQKIIVNVHSFFTNYINNPVPLAGTPTQLTAEVCSIGQQLVTKVRENWKLGTMVTPGKKRTSTAWKLCKLDSFQMEFVRDTIKEIFAKNRPPFVEEIFKNFKQKMMDDEKVRQDNGEDIVPFSCSEKTFRKLLKRMGFKFGRIQTRDALLMRPQIVMWRGKYLNKLKKNKESANPKKVIYLDETWIDPNARTGKAWVPAHCSNYRERAQFAYKKHKVSRGARVIVLNAGGEDGFVEGAMEVFPVHKRDAQGDYHDNINSEAYTKWFRKLLDMLRPTGHKYIIVQDNAPYHGSSDVPKVRATMKIMYEWLMENLPLIDRRALLPMQFYRRYELWDMVKEIKSKGNFYKIDQMAASEGHEVLRLPPYNCDLSPIEYVWKDVKYEVKKENTDQNVNSIVETAKRIMDSYDVNKWKQHIKHVERIGQQYWEVDGMFEGFYDENVEFIIPINDDEDDGNDDDDECLAGPEVMRSTVHDDAEEEDELLDI